MRGLSPRVPARHHLATMVFDGLSSPGLSPSGPTDASGAGDARMLTPAQHAARLAGIGGSDIPILLGLYAKYGKDAHWLYQYKLGLSAPEPETESMRFGTLLEPIIRDEVQRRHPDWTIQASDTVYAEEEPWALCHPDGRLLDPTHVGDGLGVLEIKNSRYFSVKNGPSDAHLAQLHWNMGVCRATWGVLAVLEGGCLLHIVPVPFDRVLWENLLRITRVFWRQVQAQHWEGL